jgi:hypothetical protein
VRKLEELSRAEKDLAISRITTGLMPPWRVGGLTPDAIRAATAALQM